MRCKCKVLSVNGVPASDGSIVPYEVMNSYINSQECKDALRDHKMIGSLSHRCRSVASAFPDAGDSVLTKTVGKDDSLIIVNAQAPTPTHYIDDLYIEDGWLWCEIKILEEDGMDDLAIQNIRRLRGMLNQGILPGISAVIVGFWKGNGDGKCDVLQKCISLKGIDVTLNPSWKAAGVTEILSYDEDNNHTSSLNSSNPYLSNRFGDFMFSEKSSNNDNQVRVKTFSDVSALGITAPKTSKINGQFTRLMAKVFSMDGVVEEIADKSYNTYSDYRSNQQKQFTNTNSNSGCQQKQYSAMTINERVKFAKLSPRERFRRLILDYRQALKAQGGVNKITPETLKVMKSLFTSDVLSIMNVVTPMVLEGKNLVTVLGAGSLGVQVRKACQAMMIPYKLALLELKKQGFVSKMKMQKIQAAYTDFIAAIQDYVFGAAPIELDNEEEGE